jgi:hypothetical protein
MAYFFVSPIDVDINLEGEELRKQVDMKTEKEKTISCPVFYDGDPVTGQVWFCFALRQHNKDDHF